MERIIENEAMVQDQNLTPAPQAGAEQKETSESMETKEQIAPVATLGQHLAGDEATQVPTTETPDAHAAVEPDTPESTDEKVDGTTPKHKDILKRMQIYSSTELKDMAIILARMADNRDIDSGAVKKKVESIKKVNGVISPTQLVPAWKCLQQGHEIYPIDEDPDLDIESEITLDTEFLEHIYVIVDGQHREEAVRKINSDSSEQMENYYYVPLVEDYVVSDLLRETNVATFPWKDRQYLSNLIMVKDGGKISIDLLKEIQKHPSATTKAALHWLTLNCDSLLYSRDIVKAMLDDEKLKTICKVDPKRFDAGKKVFKAAADALGEALAGTTTYSDWTVDQITSDATVAVTEKAEQLTRFFEWLKKTGRSAAYPDLKGQKAKDSQPFISKDSVIRNHLTSDYKDYCDSLGE